MMPRPTTPWYREPWPWLLMLGPGTVIVAGVFTSMIAFGGADGLVAEDYYKQGLAINRVLARERRATALGIAGSATAEDHRILVSIHSRAPLPKVLNLRLVHPSRAGLDRLVLLRETSPGNYAAEVDMPAVRWNVSVEGADWRINGVLDAKRQAALGDFGSTP
jgi:hypothetical protein